MLDVKKPIPHVTSLLSGVKRAKSSADVKFALIWKMENFFVLGWVNFFLVARRQQCFLWWCAKTKQNQNSNKKTSPLFLGRRRNAIIARGNGSARRQAAALQITLWTLDASPLTKAAWAFPEECWSKAPPGFVFLPCANCHLMLLRLNITHQCRNCDKAQWQRMQEFAKLSSSDQRKSIYVKNVDSCLIGARSNASFLRLLYQYFNIRIHSTFSNHWVKPLCVS